MRKSLLLLLLLFQLPVFAQQPLQKIAASYFRSTPFDKEFSKFLTHLMNDPTLVDKTINKKNDSTLFFFQGTYSSYNPFFFKPLKTKIILAEREELTNDSTSQLQTIYVYQLIGYAPAGQDGIDDVKEEFEKFCRRYKKSFWTSDYQELKEKENEQQSGEIRDFLPKKNISFYPLTVAWATSKTHNDNVFAITLRFKVFDNIAYLPQVPDDF
jgi:hypothetical protein